mmetsp:Transcript_43100/g.91850  ORF Transcript_43100/g.91850 Transcript_43100/m.91850 type:complete len:255 (+) Transcript_43100:1494-2258(+)
MLLKILCCKNGVVRAKAVGTCPSTTTAEPADAAPPIPVALSAATSSRMSASKWLSSKLAETLLPPKTRRLRLCACNCSTTASADFGDTSKLTVSKKAPVLNTGTPNFWSSLANNCAEAWTFRAMVVRPSDLWYTAYIAAMFANNTCAVQTFDVALSRRICCSRVCKVSLKAGLPWRSKDSPMMRPGILRTCFLLVAKNAAEGPPNHIGTPKRCMEPTTTSAPNSLGGLAATSANGSAATTRCAPFLCTASPTLV